MPPTPTSFQSFYQNRRAFDAYSNPRAAARGLHLEIAAKRSHSSGEMNMDLTPWNLQIWLPAFFVLGLAAMGLLFAFIAGCEKV
jgi:hypothetical protein